MVTKASEKSHSGQQSSSSHVKIPVKQFQAVIFDMDGVVTQTATVHASAWKTLFDQFLKQYSEEHHTPFKPFDIHHDYLEYVDGKKREDGLTSFLTSRNIHIPQGSPDDPSGKGTVHGLSNRKEDLFLDHLNKDGVEVYESTISLIKDLRKQGVHTAIISASRNCEEVLKRAGVLNLFDTRVDGVVAAKLNLPGKPKPDIFLEAAKRAKVSPDHAVVVEDAISGVQAGHAGHFGLVIGVNRDAHAAELKANGADVVVNDLKEVVIVSTAKSESFLPKSESPASEIDDWILEYVHYDPKQEGRRETLCALGNGYFVTRAAEAGSHDDGVHYPGTYLAGGYNRLISPIQSEGRVNDIENEDLVNFPNWLVLKFKINDEDWFNIDSAMILTFRQALNLKEGVLYRDIHFRNTQGHETLLRERRLVHMGQAHYAGLQFTITPLNWSGSLTIHSALDGTVINNNVKKFGNFKKKHLEPLVSELIDSETLFLKVQTNESHIAVAQAARTCISLDKNSVAPERKTIRQDGYIGQEMTINVQRHQSVRIEKVLSLFTSRDNAISDCGEETRKWIKGAPNFKMLQETQARTWKHLWERFDIALDIQTHLQKRASLVLRLHVFHILQSLSYQSMDRDIGVPARGWHGEAYQGHVFWDDILVFRYLNLRLPDLTASLIKYRYRRLDAARRLAQEAGFQGAMFPWQSGSDGEEETPSIYVNPLSGKWEHDYTHLQCHVNAAIVYNVWQYYQVSGNLDFMFAYGAEIILEIARFWASIATYNPQSEQYEVAGVVGPDEYHDRFPADSPNPGVRNNAYTNVMAVWVLCKALEVMNLMPADYQRTLIDKLDLKESEFHLWEEISRKMRVVFQDDDIISQFEGYETLPELDWEQFQKAHQDVQHVDDILRAKGDSPNNYKVSKQADVLMLFYLFDRDELKAIFERLGYSFKEGMLRKNIEYYQKRTTQGSTLSRVIYSWVNARSDRARSLNLFIEAFESDLNDIQGGTTPEGIHLGAMSGTLDIIQRCYTGLVMKNDVLMFNPQLPDKVERIEFTIHYRFHCVKIELTQQKLVLTALPSVARSIRIGFEGQLHKLDAGKQLEFSLSHKKNESV